VAPSTAKVVAIGYNFLKSHIDGRFPTLPESTCSDEVRWKNSSDDLLLKVQWTCRRNFSFRPRSFSGGLHASHCLDSGSKSVWMTVRLQFRAADTIPKGLALRYAAFSLAERKAEFWE
jgi:hypothetical protein